MKRRILCLMASLLLCGVASAQNGWDTNPNSHNWSSNTPIVATVSIEGIAQTDLTNLTLGAFAGDELRGRANVANHSVVNHSVVNNSVANDQFWIQVFYNYNTTEAISFKLYDAATQTEYSTCAVTKPTQDEGWGTYANPIELNFTNAPQTETQTIALTAGTNWFSTYVDITLDDLKAALVEAVPSGTIVIKSKTQNVRYINGRWIGQLNTFNPAMMYLITVNADCTIELEGTPIDPSTLSITITKGSNYIAFPYEESMAPANFFGTLPPANGDIVKSKTQNVRYLNSRWIGQLTDLEPGMGYIYVSSSDDGKVFVFPAAQ